MCIRLKFFRKRKKGKRKRKKKKSLSKAKSLFGRQRTSLVRWSLSWSWWFTLLSTGQQCKTGGFWCQQQPLSTQRSACNLFQNCPGSEVHHSYPSPIYFWFPYVKSKSSEDLWVQVSDDDWPQKPQVFSSLMPEKPGLFDKKFLVAKDSPPSSPLTLERGSMKKYVGEEVDMTLYNCILVTWGFWKDV